MTLDRRALSSVLAIGSINVDLVVAVPNLPRAGETVLGGRFARHFGGKGAAGQSISQSVLAANAAAGLSVARAGARDGMPQRAEIEAELAH